MDIRQIPVRKNKRGSRKIERKKGKKLKEKEKEKQWVRRIHVIF